MGRIISKPKLSHTVQFKPAYGAALFIFGDIS